MENPGLYTTANKFQTDTNQKIIKEYFSLIDWKNVETVIDIGCGPGDTTYNILRPKLPETVKSLMGVDVMSSMIDYANTNYKCNNCQFSVLDIGGPTIPEGFQSNFDLVLSFFCIHWIQDQRQVLGNIKNLLKPGGQLFCNIPTKHKLIEVYERLYENPRWTEHMLDFKQFHCVYQHMKDPAENIYLMLKNLGFKVKLCETKIFNFDYGSRAEVKTFIRSINPFLHQVPELQEDYLKEFLEIFLENGIDSILPNEVVVVYAKVE